MNTKVQNSQCDKDGGPPPSSKHGSVKANSPKNQPRGTKNQEGDDSVRYDFWFFRDWTLSLIEELSPALFLEEKGKGKYETVLPDGDDLRQAAANVRERFDELKKLQDQKNKIKKQEKDEAVRKEKVGQLNERIQELDGSIQEAKSVWQDVASSILEQLEDTPSTVLSRDFDMADDMYGDFCTLMALNHADAKKTGHWCMEQSLEDAAQLVELLKDNGSDGLLRRFLEAGGPRNCKYGKALQNYMAIVNHEDDGDLDMDGCFPKIQNEVFQRLALAVALELADEILVKVVHHNKFPDPVERYVHYKTAFLAGELDPAFSQFCCWEMRMIVDSDAPSEQLEWGRKSLQNFRPDHILMDDPQWRYCRIVKSDVNYQDPTWNDGERSYDQILSGGGKCGPRAWYGRYICKAFGIPTWGCKQPGHAAMARWTTDGWKTCLGGGMEVSNWEHKSGSYFLLETQALNVLGEEAEYLRRVLSLRYMACVMGEHLPKHNRIANVVLPEPSCPWESLALAQMQRLSSSYSEYVPLYDRAGGETLLERRLCDHGDGDAKISRHDSTGIVNVPATCYTAHRRKKDKVSTLESIPHGRQIFLKEDANVSYSIPKAFLTASKFELTACVCTVHRNEVLLNLTLGSSAPSSVLLPYTKGMWEDTQTVEIDLGSETEGNEDVELTLRRPAPSKYGICIKSLTLRPM